MLGKMSSSLWLQSVGELNLQLKYLLPLTPLPLNYTLHTPSSFPYHLMIISAAGRVEDTETVDECKLMGVRADAGPDTSVQGDVGGQSAFCHLAAAGHQPHINSCIWHIEQ